MGLLKTILLSGTAGAAGVGGGLYIGSSLIAWPVSNFGGYALAQVLLGGGPSVSAAIAAIGGPFIAGLLVSGLAWLAGAAIGIFAWRWKHGFPF